MVLEGACSAMEETVKQKSVQRDVVECGRETTRFGCQQAVCQYDFPQTQAESFAPRQITLSQKKSWI